MDSKRSALAGKPLKIGVPCLGLDPGSPVAISVFEVHGLGGDPIETLQATVADDGRGAVASWTYSYAKYKAKVDTSCFLFVVTAGGRTTASAPLQFYDRFKATVADAAGHPAAHQLVRLHADRGENVDACTDSQGRVDVLVVPGDYHVELLGPAPPEKWPAERDAPPPPEPAPAGETPDDAAQEAKDPTAAPPPAPSQPGCAVARLEGIHFDTDKTFMLPTAIPLMKALKRYQDRHQGDELLITGHTDTVGPGSYNLALSAERAAMVQAYLTDDADSWEARFRGGQPAGKAWGTFEVEHMLTALPDGGPPFYDGKPDGNPYSKKHRDAVSAFQQSVGLDPTGNDASAGTRRKLIEAYQAIQDTTLSKDTTVEVVACGERHPIDHPGVDEFDSPINRRVELYLWDKGQDIAPPADDCRNGQHPGCTAYDAWRAAVNHEIDPNEPDGPALAITLVDDAGEPIAAVALAAGGASATTDDQGAASVIQASDGAPLTADDSLAQALEKKPFDRPFVKRADGETWTTVKELEAGLAVSGSQATVVVSARVAVTIVTNDGDPAPLWVADAQGADVTDGVTVTDTSCTVTALALGEGRVLTVMTRDSAGNPFVVSTLDLDALAAGGDLVVQWPPDPAPGPDPVPAEAISVHLVDDAGAPIAGVALSTDQGQATTDEGGVANLPGSAGATVTAAKGSLAQALRDRPFSGPFEPTPQGAVRVSELESGVPVAEGGATIVVASRVAVTIRAPGGRSYDFRVVDATGAELSNGVTKGPTQVSVNARALGEGTVLSVLVKDAAGQDFTVAKLDLDAILGGAAVEATWPADPTPPAPAPSGPSDFAVTIFDDAGEPLAGVGVTCGASSASTGSDGVAVVQGSQGDGVSVDRAALASALAGRSFDRRYDLAGYGWTTLAALGSGFEVDGLARELRIASRVVWSWHANGGLPRTYKVRVQKGADLADGVTIGSDAVTVRAHAAGDGKVLEIVATDPATKAEEVVATLDLDGEVAASVGGALPDGPSPNPIPPESGGAAT